MSIKGHGSSRLRKNSHVTVFFRWHSPFGKSPGEGVMRIHAGPPVSLSFHTLEQYRMNKTKLIAALCASLLMAGSVSAQQWMVPEAAPVAGFSPNFAAPQPITGEPLNSTLTKDANRLVRWQGWLDIDAFSTSILNQMQKQLNDGDIEVGTFTVAESAIGKAVADAMKSNCTFAMNENLNNCSGESFQKNPKLYCWLYRHNYVDTGLYQLYVSVKGKILIGEQLCGCPSGSVTPHRDIQSLGYEFGPNERDDSTDFEWHPVYADIEIWRGAVVRVDSRGEIQFVGNEAGAVTPNAIEALPMSEWERAPSLENNPHYNPKKATGAAFVEPLDRTFRINENDVQAKAGSVQKENRVRVVPVFRYRAR